MLFQFSSPLKHCYFCKLYWTNMAPTLLFIAKCLVIHTIYWHLYRSLCGYRLHTIDTKNFRINVFLPKTKQNQNKTECIYHMTYCKIGRVSQWTPYKKLGLYVRLCWHRSRRIHFGSSCHALTHWPLWDFNGILYIYFSSFFIVLWRRYHLWTCP